MGTKKISESRRNFIKKSALLTGTILATSAINPFTAMLYATEKPDKSKPWYGFGVDIEKCIGCGMCAKACKLENNVPQEPFFFRTWIEYYTIKNDGAINVESPNGGIDGFKKQEPEEDVFKTFFVPKLCNQCAKAPCVQVCPVGATYISPEGISLVDDSYCIGCRYCIQACPYGARYLHPEKKTVDKCTLCYHRIKKGLQPACVEVCPTGARLFGDLHDKGGELNKFLKDHNCYVLKPHLNTDSKVFYNGLNEEVR
jgi:Fe-S-cluster-containing dehydrogenase component